MKPIRLMIVDDVEQVRQDLRTLLTLAGDIEIVAEAADGLGAVELAAVLTPDAVLMDLQMPVVDGYQAIRVIKDLQPACRVIVLSIHDRPEEQRPAWEAGADAFVVKGAPVEVLLAAIRRRPPGGGSQSFFGQMPKGENQ